MDQAVVDTERCRAETVEADAAAAIEQIERRARTLREDHCQRALSELRHRGETTPEEEAIVAALAARLTERLVAPPRASLHRAAARGDADTARVALELFGE
jgi:glutamyl-tRNA reductase